MLPIKQVIFKLEKQIGGVPGGAMLNSKFFSPPRAVTLIKYANCF